MFQQCFDKFEQHVHLRFSLQACLRYTQAVCFLCGLSCFDCPTPAQYKKVQRPLAVKQQKNRRPKEHHRSFVCVTVALKEHDLYANHSVA